MVIDTKLKEEKKRPSDCNVTETKSRSLRTEHRLVNQKTGTTVYSSFSHRVHLPSLLERTSSILDSTRNFKPFVGLCTSLNLSPGIRRPRSCSASHTSVSFRYQDLKFPTQSRLRMFSVSRMFLDWNPSKELQRPRTERMDILPLLC